MKHMADEIKQFKDEIIKHVSEKAVETQRHFDVVAEDIKHELRPALGKIASMLKGRINQTKQSPALNPTCG